MAICDYCNLEMTHQTTNTCIVMPITFEDGEVLSQVAYEAYGNERCGDCRVIDGGLHHPGCSMEQCPRCHDQLIACPCNTVEDDGDDN